MMTIHVVSLNDGDDDGGDDDNGNGDDDNDDGSLSVSISSLLRTPQHADPIPDLIFPTPYSEPVSHL